MFRAEVPALASSQLSLLLRCLTAVEIQTTVCDNKQQSSVDLGRISAPDLVANLDSGASIEGSRCGQTDVKILEGISKRIKQNQVSSTTRRGRTQAVGKNMICMKLKEYSASSGAEII